MSFLAVIPHIRVQGANLQTSGILLGGVPLMASTMFAHALARKLSVKDTFLSRLCGGESFALDVTSIISFLSRLCGGE